MVLFSFSIPLMIEAIKAGTKHQTTRIPRKPRKNGEPAYKVGDKAQLYYRSRMQACCDNCLLDSFENHCDFYKLFGEYPECTQSCCEWTNVFGESEIIDIIHYHHGDYKERYHEIWMGYPLALAGKEDMDSWAIADGFPEGYIQAHDWFKATTGNPNWADQNLDVIVWYPKPIIERWKQKK